MEENQEKKCSCCKKIVFGAVIATFFFTLITMVLMIVMVTKTGVLSAAAPGSDNVVISKQYDKGQSVAKALATGKPMIVWFYTDWCGFCKKFAPTYGKINKDREVKKNFAIAYVNCDAPENKQYIEEYGIQGFPTVYMVKGSQKEHIDNNILFMPDAFNQIKQRLKEFNK